MMGKRPQVLLGGQGNGDGFGKLERAGGLKPELGTGNDQPVLPVKSRKLYYCCLEC